MHVSTATYFRDEMLTDALTTPTLGGAAHAPQGNGMDRRDRVTGSGGASMSIPSETGTGIARPELLTVFFANIADFRSDRFL